MEGHLEFKSEIKVLTLSSDQSGKKTRESTLLPLHTCNADDYASGFANSILESIYDIAWQSNLCLDDPSAITFKAN